MGDFPLQSAFGILIMVGGTIFGALEWSRSRGRIGRPATVIGGSLLIGAWIAKPDFYSRGTEVASNLIDWVFTKAGA